MDGNQDGGGNDSSGNGPEKISAPKSSDGGSGGLAPVKSESKSGGGGDADVGDNSQQQDKEKTVN